MLIRAALPALAVLALVTAPAFAHTATKADVKAPA